MTHRSMNKEIKARWITALRGGRFKQGRKFLRKKDQFCCLGVLCYLAAKKEICRQERGVDNIYSYEGKSALPPYSVGVWSGLTRNVNPLIQNQNLSDLNDSGLTFPQIADLIEEFL